MYKFTILFSVLILLNACQGAKDAFTLKKKDSVDEFLIEKKSPLTLPPDFENLPKPIGSEAKDDNTENSSDEIQNILISNEKKSSDTNKSTNQSSVEKSILDKIK